MADNDYVVGYRKPPKKHQFKKGQSGNPGGRPKGSKRSEDIVIDNLNMRIPMHVNGRKTTTTVFDAIIKSQVKKAVDDKDTKAAKFLLDERNKAEQKKYYMEKTVEFIEEKITKALSHSDPKQIEKYFSEARDAADRALIEHGKECEDE